MTAQVIDTTKLEQLAPSLAKVLVHAKVMGSSDNPTMNMVETRSFINSLVEFPNSDDVRSYYEYTFPTGVRLVGTFSTVNNEAVLDRLGAYDHPVNESIDYDRINYLFSQALATVFPSTQK